MNLIDWINRRLQPDQARHAAVVLVAATLAAHATFLAPLHPWLAEAWMRALWAAVAVCLIELVQHYTGRGVGSWNDVAANIITGALVAMATTA
jgi:hypothetical protein